jgi:hypothetical protein
MAEYVRDPDNPLGPNVAVIEIQKRDPLRVLKPILIHGWLKRDTWSRREALMLLAGYNPSVTQWTETAEGFGQFAAGNVGYLDALTESVIYEAKVSWRHPRWEEALEQFLDLADYARGNPLEERRTPEQWIAWAASKGFTPYWLAWPWSLGETSPGRPNSPAQTMRDASSEGKESPTPVVPVSSTDNMQIATRQNDVGLLIDTVVTQLEGAGVRVSVAQVMAGLVKLKGTGCCIVDADPAGQVVYWRNDDGEKKMLTKDALKARLKRRQRRLKGSQGR